MFKSWSFDHIRQEEKVISTFKRHPIVMFKGIVISFIILCIDIAMIIFLKFNVITIGLLMASLLIIVVVNYYYIYLWKNDLYVLTTERLIDVDQHGFFKRVVTETALDQIQEVKVVMNGPLENILGFGNIIVQTAGPSDNIVLEVTPKPFQTQKLINKAYHEYRKKIGVIQNSNTIKGGKNE